MIHYITSTGVGNAWVGNELMALAGRGIPFRLHSLHKPTATFFKSEQVKQIAEQTNYIYPLSVWRILPVCCWRLFYFQDTFSPRCGIVFLAAKSHLLFA